MSDSPERTGPRRDRDALHWAAVGLLAAFSAWLIYLGCHLYREVDARLHHQVAALPSVGVLVSNFGAAALAPILVLSAFFLRERTSGSDTGFVGVFLNLLAVVLGAAVGWGIAVTLVPFDEVDGAVYSKIGAGVTAFMSGFVVSYVHPLVKGQLDTRPQAFLVHVGLGAAALLITGLAVTSNRTEYLEFARLERADLAAVEAIEKAEVEAIKAKFAQEYLILKQRRFEERGSKSAKVLGRVESAPCCWASALASGPSK